MWQAGLHRLTDAVNGTGINPDAVLLQQLPRELLEHAPSGTDFTDPTQKFKYLRGLAQKHKGEVVEVGMSEWQLVKGPLPPRPTSREAQDNGWWHPQYALRPEQWQLQHQEAKVNKKGAGRGRQHSRVRQGSRGRRPSQGPAPGGPKDGSWTQQQQLECGRGHVGHDWGKAYDPDWEKQANRWLVPCKGTSPQLQLAWLVGCGAVHCWGGGGEQQANSGVLEDLVEEH
jgi:hypothetical protein